MMANVNGMSQQWIDPASKITQQTRKKLLAWFNEATPIHQYTVEAVQDCPVGWETTRPSQPDYSTFNDQQNRLYVNSQNRVCKNPVATQTQTRPGASNNVAAAQSKSKPQTRQALKRQIQKLVEHDPEAAEYQAKLTKADKKIKEIKEASESAKKARDLARQVKKLTKIFRYAFPDMTDDKRKTYSEKYVQETEICAKTCKQTNDSQCLQLQSANERNEAICAYNGNAEYNTEQLFDAAKDGKRNGGREEDAAARHLRKWWQAYYNDVQKDVAQEKAKASGKYGELTRGVLHPLKQK